MSVFLAGLIWIIISTLIATSFKVASESQLVSPSSEHKVLGVNQWFPQYSFNIPFAQPEITARSAFFIETNTGQVIFSKNSQTRLPIASLTKIMTAVVALEHRDLEDKLWVSQKAADMEPDKMFLISGEQLTLKELLYGIFLISANDAAEVLAQDSTGDREEFIRLMNQKAIQLGMKDSHFVNPTGLDEEGANSYSTAYDLSILSRYAIKKFPELLEISKTPHVYLEANSYHQDYDMYTGINLVTTYPGIVGFKTGFTPKAGYTLITIARSSGYEVLGILLDSQSRRDEARKLLDYSFANLEKRN